MTTRCDTQPKRGKPIYSFTVYENVRRATVLIDNKDYLILMVSFDNIDNIYLGRKQIDYESIILHGIPCTSSISLRLPLGAL